MNGLGLSLRAPQPAELKARSQALHCTALSRRAGTVLFKERTFCLSIL